MRFTGDKRGADPMSYDNSGHHYSDCTGPGGCDCDERRYGYRGGGSGGGGNTGCLWLIAVVILSIIGVWNELIALILLFIVAAVLLLSR